jgi:hypothetical protein
MIDIEVSNVTLGDCVVLKLGSIYDFRVIHRKRFTDLLLISYCICDCLQECIENGLRRFKKATL